jgi:hypothetical protein
LLRDDPSDESLGYFQRNDYPGTTLHSFNSCLMHCVFSVKDRRPLLASGIRRAQR